jgi:hypothetical protein
MTSCIYSGDKRKISKATECQFGGKAKFVIGDAHFCSFHLPWSPDDLYDRFGIKISDEHKDRDKFKDRWDDVQKKGFNDRLRNMLLKNDDLTGTTIPGDIEITDTLPEIVIVDAVFPQRLKINQHIPRIDLHNFTFYGPVEIMGGANKASDFSCSRFHEIAIFFGTFTDFRIDDSEFKKIARFRNSTFAGMASFCRCNF